MIEITAEDIRAAIPACRPAQARTLAPYITARLDNVPPYDAMLQANQEASTCARFERWYEAFCKATDRPYEPWVSGFDRPGRERGVYIPQRRPDGRPFHLGGFET